MSLVRNRPAPRAAFFIAAFIAAPLISIAGPGQALAADTGSLSLSSAGYFAKTISKSAGMGSPGAGNASENGGGNASKGGGVITYGDGGCNIMASGTPPSSKKTGSTWRGP